MEDIFSDILEAGEEAEKQEAKSIDLGPLSELAKRQAALEAKPDQIKVDSLLDHIKKISASIKDVEEVLKAHKKVLNAVRQKEIPETMKAFNLSEVTTDTGAKITIKSDVSCTIKDPDKLYAFVSDRGDGAIIKDNVTVVMPEDSKELFDALSTMLEAQDAAYERKRAIHGGTLKKYVKDRQAEGVALPEEAIKVFEYSYAKLKL